MPVCMLLRLRLSVWHQEMMDWNTPRKDKHHIHLTFGTPSLRRQGYLSTSNSSLKSAF